MMNDDDTAKGLNTDFTSTGGAHGNVTSYAHPRADEIRAKSKAYLEHSSTGRRLLQLAEQRNIAMQILANRDMQRFVPDAGHVYIGLSTDEEPDYRHITLMLGGALREAEHFLVGYAPPDQNSDPVDFAALSFAKELDIIINMCRIAEELHHDGALQNILDALEEMGHGELYRSYREQQSADDIMELFIPDNFGAEGD